MGKLNDWVKETSPFLKFESGDAIHGVYTGYQMIADPFNPDKEKVRYKIEVAGKTKYFDSANSRIAMTFDNIAIGEEVIIAATGEGMKRRYSVALANPPSVEEATQK